MTWLNPNILSLFGVVFLLVAVGLLAFSRSPALSLPQSIKAFGIELNISGGALLLIIGLLLAGVSTYLQVRDDGDRIIKARLDAAAAQERAKALEIALQRAGKLTVSIRVKLAGIGSPQDLPILADLQCRYYVGDHWIENAKVNPGIALDYLVTLEDVTSGMRVEPA